MCVCFLPIYSGRKIRWKYQPGSHRISHPPSFCGACLYFLARRIQPFLSLVDCEVELRKNPSYRDSNSRPNVSEGYEVTNWATGKKKERKERREKKKTNTWRLLTQRLCCSWATLNQSNAPPRHALRNTESSVMDMCNTMYVCMVITYSRVWINRVRLPIPLVVSWTGKMNIPLSPCVPENLVSRDGFSRPVPRQPAHLHTQAESGAYLRDSSRVPRRRPFMKPPYAIGTVPSLSGHAIAYRWRSLPRVRRHRASKPQGSSERVLPWQ